jgi:hypothetical protein
MVVFCKLKDSLCKFLRVGRGIVFEIKLNFLNGFGEHEVMLWNFDFLAIKIAHKLLMYLYDFFEVQFFEVDIHSPDKEVNEVALLKFVISYTTKCFQHL